jgi:decaprenyl-phosphate phosphoribosyltransferase
MIATTAEVAPVLRLLRPHQWVKNVFVGAPLFFTPAALSAATVGEVVLGTIVFCLAASAVYILNDYLDREADRQHPVKRYRPLAAGTVAVPTAFGLLTVLLAAGLLLASLLSPTFAAFVLVYVGVNLAYSLGLKNASIVDVMVIAFGFVLRVEAGAVLAGADLSVWIIVCTGLLALFLAIAKRRDDVVRSLNGGHRGSLAGYTRQYLDVALAVVLSALFISYIIYTTDREVMGKYGTEHLYVTVPFVAAGVLRYLQITFVEERSGSPTLLVLTDPFLMVTGFGWLSVFGYLIYS